MGNSCFSTQLTKLYQKQYNEINIYELRSQWSLIKQCKIKQIFERQSTKVAVDRQQKKLTYDKFCEIFTQLIHYQKVQKKKIYSIFDQQNKGYINWNNFYNWISICYFGNQKLLAVVLFMIFDQNNQKELTQAQLTLLMDLNAIYLKQQSKENQIINVDTQQIINYILNGKKSIGINQWLNKSPQFIDYNQFRRLFNIFKQEKLQKQLVGNFGSKNQLYDQHQNKYISYIVSYKWFQTWKLYIENQYGIVFNIQDKNPVTLKSIKTKKTFKICSTKSKKQMWQQHAMTIKKIPLNENSSIKYINIQNMVMRNRQNNRINNNNLQEIKNIDLVRSILGEKPKKIYNSLLQGQFAGTLKLGLVQNYDYVFVSQKIWNYLNQIYIGQPQFRRTGFDQIQLYPKLIRIYSGTSKGEILFSSQMYRQISNYRTIQDLMSKCLQFTTQYIQKINVYYRSIGMLTWSKINNYNDAFIDLSPHPIIFLVYLQKKGENIKKFEDKYLRIPNTIEEVNLGDLLRYQDLRINVSKDVLFFNKTDKNRYIIHFMGESYTNDISLTQKQFIKRCKIYPQSYLSLTPQNVKKKTKISKKYRGIQDVKNLSFVSSIILQCFNNCDVKEMLTLLFNRTINHLNQNNQNSLTVVLAYLYHLLKNNQRVQPQSIIHLVQVFFPQYSNFDITHNNQVNR